MNDFQSQNVSVTNKTWIFRYLSRLGFFLYERPITTEPSNSGRKPQAGPGSKGTLLLVSDWVKEEEKGRRGRE